MAVTEKEYPDHPSPKNSGIVLADIAIKNTIAMIPAAKNDRLSPKCFVAAPIDGIIHVSSMDGTRQITPIIIILLPNRRIIIKTNTAPSTLSERESKRRTAISRFACGQGRHPNRKTCELQTAVERFHKINHPLLRYASSIVLHFNKPCNLFSVLTIFHANKICFSAWCVHHAASCFHKAAGAITLDCAHIPVANHQDKRYPIVPLMIVCQRQFHHQFTVSLSS